jgi:hypothetical protein
MLFIGFQLHRHRVRQREIPQDPQLADVCGTLPRSVGKTGPVEGELGVLAWKGSFGL